MRSTTADAMQPVLAEGIDGFVGEPDPVVAEGAILANLKLIEAIAAYTKERSLFTMAAMARANYAFGFVQDDLEAARLARPNDRPLLDSLTDRVKVHYQVGRQWAERALQESDAWDVVGDRKLDALSPEEFATFLEALEVEDAEDLYWLCFNWGATLQVSLDAAEATQLPKLEAAMRRVLALNDRVFFDVGPHLLAGVFHGFRSPALGGDPKAAEAAFATAKAQGGVLLPDVLLAQFVYAQTEREEDFVRLLTSVIEAPIRQDRALLESLAKKKACRLLANVDTFFLTDPKPIPEACHRIAHRYPLRAGEPQ